MKWRKRKNPREPLPEFGAKAFAGYTDYRYGNQQAVTLAGRARVKPIFSTGKRKQLIDRVAEEMSDWRSTPFENEGPLTQALRSYLCLAGEDWRQSDAEASFIVGSALKAIGIPRPSWNDGQPGAVDSPDRCSWCAGPVDDIGNGKAARYCSAVCARSAFESRDFALREMRDRAYAAAQRALQRSRMNARKCKECGAPFQPIREKSEQRYGSFVCGSKARLRVLPPPSMASISVTLACLYCGADFQSRHKKALICSKTCHAIRERMRKGRPPVRISPQVFDHYVTSVVDPPRITPERFDFVLWSTGGPPPAGRITDALFEAA